MKVGIAVFAYNRSYYLKQVLNGLQKNTGVEKIYLFQDGLKDNEYKIQWNEVRNMINDITWCDKVCSFSDNNKGYAKLIVDGINFVLEENDAVIVLEDNCVPEENFIDFMKQCFNKYQNDKNIFCVSGYSWPIEQEKTEYDIYGCGRICPWGWGTWKDRWEKYNSDSNILKRIKNDSIKSYNLAVWGNDLENMFLHNLLYKDNSWVVYWALNIIENQGICINPYKSLVRNIEHNSKNINCEITNKYRDISINKIKKVFKLPDKVKFSENIKKEFIRLYGGYSALKETDLKESILIYGLGNFYLRNEKEVNDKYNIKAFIDQRKNGWFAGKKIIQISEIKNYQYDKIIIMIEDIQECINITKKLLNLTIDYKKIMIGHSLFGYYSEMIDKISVLPNGNILAEIDEIKVEIQSKDEFNNVFEVLNNHIYSYFINNNKKDIVFDIGMNIGDATLYFLKNKKVEKVFGYEPFQKTFLKAEENLKQYLEFKERVEIFPYGISNENNKRIIKFNNDMTCGQSSIENIQESTFLFYKSMGLIQDEKEEKEEIEVKKASEVFKPIIDKYFNYNIILKMNCEGEEYGIIEELFNEQLLDKFIFIMLEWHYKGKENIVKFLQKAGFSYWCSDKTKNMGLIYAYNLKNNN